MKAKDVMSTPVVSIGPDALLRDIVSSMLDKHISGVLVMQGEQLLGVINESDLLRRYEIGTDRSAAEQSWWEQLVHRDKVPIDYVKSHARKAKDIMVSPAVSVDEEAALQEVASIFAARHIRRIAVMRDQHVVGVVTRADLVKAIALKTKGDNLLDKQSDEAIRWQLLQELESQHWWHPTTSTFEVEDGIVRFHGLYEDEGHRRAARVAAENVLGVRGVEDVRIPTASFQPMF